MPTVSVRKQLVDEALEHSFNEEQFEELCFSYGMELDEICTEKHPRTGVEEKSYKIEIAANRFDLLCFEGLIEALLVFLGRKAPAVLKAVAATHPVQLTALPEVQGIRPYVLAAVLRGVHFTQDAFDSFIDLQDKLHQNICRKRTLVAIGTHDLDTVVPPFTYTAKPPTDIKFVPLNQTREFNAAELVQFYSTDSHLRAYLPIIQHFPRYPVIYDSAGTVLSMPPIINGDHSKVSKDTRNIFIECTATDLHKATVVLDTIVAMYHRYCDSIEQVCVTQASGSSCVYPKLNYWELKTSVKYINSQVGVTLPPEMIVHLLQRMGLQSTVDGDTLVVSVPPTRHDILHQCDIVEDVAISFGFNNIPMQTAPIHTAALQLPINKFTDLVRTEVASAGFTEVLTFSLCSQDDISTKLNDPHGADIAVHIANPKTSEFEVVRTTLLPGILKTVSNGRGLPLPLKLFEIQDVVLKDPTAGTGAVNRRRFCAVYCGKASGFEIIHGLLDRFMQLMRWKFGSETNCYHLVPTSDPTYLPGRCATINDWKDNILGKTGVLHPDVLAAFEITLPCSYLEIEFEYFL